MSNRDYMRQAEMMDTFCKWTIVLSSLLLVAMVVAGCSADKDRPRAIDLAVKGGYTPGEAIGTRNQLPQGGADEKSGSTPSESSK